MIITHYAIIRCCGTSTYVLFPDTQAISHGITDPLRGQVSGIKYSIVRPPVDSLPVLANTIYNQVTNEQVVVWVKREVIDYQTVLQAP